MDDWMIKGCEACRQSALSHGGSPLSMLGESIPLHARLKRCHECGSYWIENEREAHVIPEAEARADFPDTFA